MKFAISSVSLRMSKGEDALFGGPLFAPDPVTPSPSMASAGHTGVTGASSANSKLLGSPMGGDEANMDPPRTPFDRLVIFKVG